MEGCKSVASLYCQMNDANIQRNRRNRILRKTKQANILRNQIQNLEKPKPDPNEKNKPTS
jgi:hypothetical protein